jgi:hypothetical protein
MRIADLACGTGTLLMAAQQAITDNYIEASIAAGKHVGKSEIRELHGAAIEDVLHGYDVLTSAVHLTASTLALLAPDIAFQRMHLYVMPLGQRVNGSPMLGSIEFLRGGEVSTQVDLFGEVEEDGAAVAVTGTGGAASQAPLPPLDLCAMNPPFTRSVGNNLLFGSLPKEERAAMQKRLALMLRPGHGLPPWASSTAGLGSVFVAVAHTRIKDGGRIALVLPAGLASGVAWKKTRDLFAQRYVVEFLVASHDPEQWSFSENTSLSEVLVIARKLHDEESIEDATSLCINLWRNTKTPIDALALAEAVRTTEPADVEGDKARLHAVAPLRIGNDVRGEIVRVPWKSMRSGQWYGCEFAQTDLVRAAHFLRQGKIFIPAEGVVGGVPLRPLSEVGSLGPDRRDIYDGFELTDSPTTYLAYWGHQADSVLCMQTQSNKYLSPLAKARPGRPLRRVDLLWPRSGRIMLAERLRLNTQRLVCVRLPDYALSNVWWPLRLHDDQPGLEKALVIWGNSTLGLLSLLSYREPTEGSWVQLKKDTLEQSLMLDVGQLTSERIEHLAAAYDEVATTTLLPLSQIAQDSSRKVIDKAVAEALDSPPLDTLRMALAREPVISGLPLY